MTPTVLCAPLRSRTLYRSLAGGWTISLVGEVRQPACLPLLPKAAALYETTRRRIARLEIGLEAMQVQRSEGVAERNVQPLGHVPLPGERSADPVAELGALKSTANALTQLYRAEDCTIRAAA